MRRSGLAATVALTAALAVLSALLVAGPASAASAPRPATVWTKAGLALSPKQVPAGGSLGVSVTVTAGRVAGANGVSGRAVLVETSPDKASWSAVSTARTDRAGRATVSVAAPPVSGALFVRVTVPATGPFKSRTTSPQYVQVLPRYAPTAPATVTVPSGGVPVAATLFGSHPVDGTPTAAGTVRLWDTSTSWAKVETAQGGYSWGTLDAAVAAAEAAGQEVLLVLGSTPSWAASGQADGSEFDGVGSSMPPRDPAWFEEYVRAVVSRYGSRIAAYQVWNEANIPSFWRGTPEQMADLTERAYRVIKQLQPSATVVAASTGSRWVWAFSEFYPAYLRALAARNWPVDVYSVHLYPLSAGTPVDRALLIGMMRQALADAGAPAKPVWETEINYGVTNPGLGEAARIIPDGEVPSYVARTYLDSLRFGIARSYWYAWTRSYALLGIQMFDGRVAADAYVAVHDWLVGSLFHGCTATGAVVDCSFSRGGTPFHVLYLDAGAPVSVAVPAGLGTLTRLDGSSGPVSGAVTVSQEPVRVS